MRDYLNIGPTPVEENCAQVGSANYFESAMRECRAFVGQIKRAYPPVPGAIVLVKSFPHDFGTYHEVCVSFDHTDEAQMEYAFKVESDPEGLLAMWDDEARAELAR